MWLHISAGFPGCKSRRQQSPDQTASPRPWNITERMMIRCIEIFYRSDVMFAEIDRTLSKCPEPCGMQLSSPTSKPPRNWKDDVYAVLNLFYMEDATLYGNWENVSLRNAWALPGAIMEIGLVEWPILWFGVSHVERYTTFLFPSYSLTGWGKAKQTVLPSDCHLDICLLGDFTCTVHLMKAASRHPTSRAAKWHGLYWRNSLLVLHHKSKGDMEVDIRSFPNPLKGVLSPMIPNHQYFRACDAIPQ